MSTIYPFDHARVAMYRERARRLGELMADNKLTDDDAQGTLNFVVEEASKAAPDLNRSGLRARLVWDMRDQAHAMLLAKQREERAREKALANVAEAGFKSGQSVSVIKQNMVSLAKSMKPPASVEMCEAALKLGQWRAKWAK